MLPLNQVELNPTVAHDHPLTTAQEPFKPATIAHIVFKTAMNIVEISMYIACSVLYDIPIHNVNISTRQNAIYGQCLSL